MKWDKLWSFGKLSSMVSTRSVYLLTSISKISSSFHVKLIAIVSWRFIIIQVDVRGPLWKWIRGKTHCFVKWQAFLCTLMWSLIVLVPRTGLRLLDRGVTLQKQRSLHASLAEWIWNRQPAFDNSALSYALVVWFSSSKRCGNAM